MTGAAVGVTSFSKEGTAGTFTYTYTADCLAAASLASLGLNNNYYQYYSYLMTIGTWLYGSATTV